MVGAVVAALSSYVFLQSPFGSGARAAIQHVISYLAKVPNGVSRCEVPRAGAFTHSMLCWTIR